MRFRRTSYYSKALLWWIAIIALAVTFTLYFALAPQAQYDVSIAQKRIFLPVIGIVIAGLCLIAGTAGRWFYK